jgi:para-aminobenzoate synthetase component 1
MPAKARPAAAAVRRYPPCRVHVKEVRLPVGLPALSDYYSRLRSPAVLGANEPGTGDAAFSYWAARPADAFVFPSCRPDVFDRLRSALGRYRVAGGDCGLPPGVFCGGWIGYFGYELGRCIERMGRPARDDVGMPLVRLCFYDRVICFDHRRGVFLLIALEMPRDAEGPREKLSQLEAVLDECRGRRVAEPAPADLEGVDFSSVSANMDRSYYRSSVAAIKEYIRDGEVYQVNFSQRFECPSCCRPVELYHWLNRYNPSGYAAYIGAGGCHIVSASPEMFVTIAGGRIRTKPIKGTRRRVGGRRGAASINERNAAELLASEKDKAELNMIIDLERNDLGKICRYGTIRVVQPRTIETYSTVFHGVATVEGVLRDGVDVCDVLRAVFPGGSITGAPKYSAMKIIERLEPTARGVYTGSIGYIAVDGSVCLNIAIRTIVVAREKAFLQTGGGIVADSSADSEYLETLVKARALVAAVRSASGSGRR